MLEAGDLQEITATVVNTCVTYTHSTFSTFLRGGSAVTPITEGGTEVRSLAAEPKGACVHLQLASAALPCTPGGTEPLSGQAPGHTLVALAPDLLVHRLSFTRSPRQLPARHPVQLQCWAPSQASCSFRTLRPRLPLPRGRGSAAAQQWLCCCPPSGSPPPKDGCQREPHCRRSAHPLPFSISQTQLSPDPTLSMELPAGVQRCFDSGIFHGQGPAAAAPQHSPSPSLKTS